jgi:hypothetical protein
MKSKNQSIKKFKMPGPRFNNGLKSHSYLAFLKACPDYPGPGVFFIEVI